MTLRGLFAVALLSVFWTVPCLADGPALVAGPAATPAQPVVSVRAAQAQGKLKVEGVSPRSYRGIRLRLTNRTREPLSVDLIGSFLEPKGRKVQRLGLGPVLTPGRSRRPEPGTVVVDLAPEEECELEVATVCLDAGRPCPTDELFVLAAAELPAVREGVMRWWADHPEASQQSVNSAIWQNRPRVSTPHAPGGAPLSFLPLQGALHGGRCYVLMEGVLLELMEDGGRRFLGTEILQVFPGADALHAVAHGQGGDLELWRYVETGEDRWRRLAAIPDGTLPRALLLGERGDLMVLSETALYRYFPGEQQLVPTFELQGRTRRLSAAFDGTRRLRLSLEHPAEAGIYQGGEWVGNRSARVELRRLDLGSAATASVVRSFWNVALFEHGPGGTFALTPGGRLRRLMGRSFRSTGCSTALREIVWVGERILWGRSQDGHLVAVRLPSTSEAFAVPGPTPEHLSFDPVRGDAVGVLGRSLVRISASDGSVKTLFELPAASPPVAPSGPAETPAETPSGSDEER